MSKASNVKLKEDLSVVRFKHHLKLGIITVKADGIVAPGAFYPLRVEVFLDGPGNVAESILECFLSFHSSQCVHICIQLYVYN